MVEPVSLTLGMVAAALLTKAAERGGENLADAAKAAVGRLAAWLRDRFARDDDQPAMRAIETAERITDSDAVRHELAAVIDARAATDGEFRAALVQLVADAEQHGASVKAVTQTAWGSNIVQVSDVTGSTVSTSIGGQAGTGSPVR